MQSLFQLVCVCVRGFEKFLNFRKQSSNSGKKNRKQEIGNRGFFKISILSLYTPFLPKMVLKIAVSRELVFSWIPWLCSWSPFTVCSVSWNEGLIYFFKEGSVNTKLASLWKAATKIRIITSYTELKTPAGSLGEAVFPVQMVRATDPEPHGLWTLRGPGCRSRETHTAATPWGVNSHSPVRSQEWK